MPSQPTLFIPPPIAELEAAPATSEAPISPTDYTQLDGLQLSRELHKRGLKKSGKKPQLIDRLRDDDSRRKALLKAGSRFTVGLPAITTQED